MTSGRQVEDGGVLYDEIEADDEDIVAEGDGATVAAALPAIEWTETSDLPEGVIGADLIQVYV